MVSIDLEVPINHWPFIYSDRIEQCRLIEMGVIGVQRPMMDSWIILYTFAKGPVLGSNFSWSLLNRNLPNKSQRPSMEVCYPPAFFWATQATVPDNKSLHPHWLWHTCYCYRRLVLLRYPKGMGCFWGCCEDLLTPSIVVPLSWPPKKGKTLETEFRLCGAIPTLVMLSIKLLNSFYYHKLWVRRKKLFRKFFLVLFVKGTSSLSKMMGLALFLTYPSVNQEPPEERIPLTATLAPGSCNPRERRITTLE